MSLSAVISKVAGIGSGSPDVAPEAFELSVRRALSEQLKFVVQAAAGVITAGTALAETPVGKVRQKSRLIGAVWVPSAAVVGHAADLMTLIVRKRAAALPGTQVALLSFALDTPTTDDMVAWAANNIYSNRAGVTAGAATAFDFLADDVLTFEVTKTGSGRALPISEFYFLFEPRD